MFIDLRALRERREKREKNIDMKTSIGCFPYAPQLGIQPATQVCALTQNQTHNLWCTERCSNQLSHPARAQPYS